MRWLFSLFVFLFLPIQWAGAAPAIPWCPGYDPSCSLVDPTPTPTAVPSSLPTAVPNPSPTLLPTPLPKPEIGTTEKADKWEAQKQNDGMFNSVVEANTQLYQADSFTVQGNLMFLCVDTSLKGRTDGACASDPTNPECVGMNQALDHATKCIEYFSPASLGCKRYGDGDFSMMEWFAFGTQYQNSVSACDAAKNKTDPRADKLKSTNFMIEFTPEALVGKSAGSSLLGADRRNSDITGKAKTLEIDLEAKRATTWKTITSKLKDNSFALGYSENEILRRTSQGESFLKIVSDSPFAESLNEPQRREMEEGITNSTKVAAQARAFHSEQLAQEKDHTLEPALAEEETLSLSSSPEKIGASKISEPMPTANPEYENVLVSLAAKSAPMADSPALPRRMSEAERIAGIEAAARAKMASAKNRSPASDEPPPPQDHFAALANISDISLFERVHQTYGRHRAGMRAPDAEEVRSERIISQTPALRDL